MRNKQNGITLVALVVTIIILLILAGVTISQLTGSGIFAKAIAAKEEQQKREEEEEIKLIIKNFIIEKTLENTKNNMDELDDEQMVQLADYFDQNNCEYVLLKGEKTSSVIKDGESNFTEVYVKVKNKSKFKFVVDNKLQIIEIIKESKNEGTGDSVGTGNPEEPEEVDPQKKVVPEGWIGITTEAELKNIPTTGLDKKYILMANITITSTWTPIGDATVQFTGEFDGNYYEISGIYTSTTTTADYQGLFGYIGETGKVTNLTISTHSSYGIYGGSYIGVLVGYNKGTIENVNVSGKVYMNVTGTSSAYKESVGGLVGYNTGTISKCYSAVNVQAKSTSIQYYRYIGGLVGENDEGTIEKSASTGTVTAKNTGAYYIGGLVGATDGTVANCYTTGQVDGGTVGTSVGGIAGRFSFGTIKNTYSIATVTGKSNVGGVIGAKNGSALIPKNSYWVPEKAGTGVTYSEGTSTTVQALMNKSYLKDKFDFKEIWGIDEGRSLPYIKGITIPDVIYINKEFAGFSGGDGTKENPYIVTTQAQLEAVGTGLEAYYRLDADISISKNFSPIGDSVKSFTGEFDGNNHTIKNLRNSSSTTADYQGLFGYIGETGKVSNLTISTHSSYGIYGGSYIGVLAGYNKGTIENVNVSGRVYMNVTGTSSEYKESVGGLVGYNTGTISKCYSAVNVQAKSTSIQYYRYIGGLVGKNEEGTIEKSASTGTITAKNTGAMYIGGLVGHHSGTIENCYTTGQVSGGTVGTYVGGLVGRFWSGTIKNTYSIATVTGKSSVGGLIGNKNGSSLTLTNSYWVPEKAGTGATTTEGTSITLEELQTQSTYVGWDFKEDDNDTEYIWYMKNNLPEINF